MRSARMCLIAALVPLAGCAPFATYPPDEGALLRSIPREPVPGLMAEAIRYTHENYGGASGDDFAVNLPQGTPDRVYDRVLERLGSAHAMDDPGESAYHVTKVRVRGMKATVDVFYPTADGTYQLATLQFVKPTPFEDYEHRSTRLWHTGDQPPPPRHVMREAPVPYQVPLASE